MTGLDRERRGVRAYAPGRTELAGNHTDHQGGRVIAATLDCGVEVVAYDSGSKRVRVESEGFPPVAFDMSDVSPRDDELGTTAALVRGIVAGLRASGVQVSGFDARVRSDIPAGGGLSSSAAFELALARALELLFHGDDVRDPRSDSPSSPGEMAPSASLANRLDAAEALEEKGPWRLSPLQLARIGQAAERDWFGKPCGLMDQLSIALGGVNEMDFADGDVRFDGIDFDFERAGYALLLVDTHCDHARYTDEYARVAKDMDDVARLLGARTLSQVPERAFLLRLADVRESLGDLPALRALHYYHEMVLVDARANALREGNIEAFLTATRRSSASSAQYLQNVSVADRAEQPAMLVLALADHLAGPDGAVRIHGGGFGGTVQAFVPERAADSFAEEMDGLVGSGSCKRYRVAGKGAYAEWLL